MKISLHERITVCKDFTPRNTNPMNINSYMTRRAYDVAQSSKPTLRPSGVSKATLEWARHR